MAQTITPQVKSAMDNLMLNMVLRDIDKLVQEKCAKPETQMGVLMLAQAVAFRRVLKANNVTDRIQRKRFLKLALTDFHAKLNQFASMDDVKPNDQKQL